MDRGEFTLLISKGNLGRTKNHVHL